jgi:HD-GYP domain-containing protein (c-di-GMP phosphodiesterase class II)/HAMP domain-containing protein
LETPGLQRYPLHAILGGVFALALLLSGLVLGTFHYRQATKIIVSGSEQLFVNARQAIEQDLLYTYQPIRHLLSLLASSPSIQARTLAQRLDLLTRFAQALRNNPKLDSLHLAYADGDVFAVRPLRTAALRQYFAAPEQAAFLVWSIERDGKRTLGQYLFFDDQLRLISRIENPDETFDPRQRRWFHEALASHEQVTTAPYKLFSTQQVGTTLALAAGPEVIVGTDLTLADLSQTLSQHRVTASTELALFDSQGKAVAFTDSAHLVQHHSPSEVADLSPALKTFMKDSATTAKGTLLLDDRRWVVSRTHVDEGGPHGLDLALLIPENELLSEAYRIRWQGALITLAGVLLSLPLGWLCSLLLARPLRALVRDAEAIRSFDFSGSSSRSMVREIDQLAQSMERMRDSLASFMQIAASLSSETHYPTLLTRVLQETLDIAEADAGLLYLLDLDSGRFQPQAIVIHQQPKDPQALNIPTYASLEEAPEWLRLALSATQTHSLALQELPDHQPILERLQCTRINLVATGLHNRRGNALGVLVLLRADRGALEQQQMFRSERVAFIEAISGVAAMCIDSQRLLDRQKRLLNAFVQLLAGAIDAKSPYTGGHCQRVPELTFMLARAAAADQQTFAEYQPDENDWEALQIAAWLHDCGKVTTPEYVVDKATKLETLYDRIHEIRTRFEVLKRDVWISYWQALAEGGEATQLADQRQQQLAALDDDFAFVAACNLGSESMSDEDQARLQRIAQRTWLRTLDDRLGLSWEELQRHPPEANTRLPVTERVLADKAEHLIPQPESEQIPPDNPWGFKVDPPTYKFNRGELYNLSVKSGTLTPEERYIIKGHMLQTIRMLSLLPFPPHLKQVPEIAGGHHERMDGTGYPKRLTRDQMSLPARMMAIADIFEALTAADRPYKTGKPLSEALTIMANMCRNGHIDPQLFELFVRKEVYLDYARQYLAQEQMDAVDPTQLLARARVE